MNNRLHEVGQRFGNLVVVSAYHEKIGSVWKHLTKCVCGNSHLVAGYDLRRGRTKSCGCRHWIGTHNKSGSPEYAVWAAMVQRCSNKNNNSYKNYGGRGIKVCSEWLNFKCFINDMGERPSKNMTIERIDNDKGYFIGNCKWGTRSEQSINQRIRSDNKVGCTGVTYIDKKNMYVAKIQRDGSRVTLGFFKTLKEAIAARLAAEKITSKGL